MGQGFFTFKTGNAVSVQKHFQNQSVKRCRIWAVGVFSFVLFLSAVAAAAPIDVKGRESETITFSSLLIRDSELGDISEAAEQYRVYFLEELRKYGYNAMGAENLVFDNDKSQHARFVLGGTLSDSDCSEQVVSVSRCEVTVMWELLDRKSDSVVYKVKSIHRGFVNSVSRDEFEKTINGMLMGAFDSLLARENFVKIITGETASAPAATNTRTNTQIQGDILACNAGQNPLPKKMSTAMGATVVLKVDNGVGAGVFVSPDGFILTAYHVVEGTSEVIVKDSNDREIKAAVVRYDKAQDVALLKVSGRGYDCLDLEYSQPLVGDEIFAIGAPAGEKLGFSVTKGVISGIRREDDKTAIQVDASVNPGNSGGPLLSKDGKVVGIVFSKVMREGFEGIGFAVPSKEAMASISVSDGKKTTIDTTPVSVMVGPAASEGVEDTPDPGFGVPVDSDEEMNRVLKLRRKYRLAKWGWGVPSGLAISAAACTWLYALEDDDLNGMKWASVGIMLAGAGSYIASKVYQRKQVKKIRALDLASSKPTLYAAPFGAGVQLAGTF